MENARTKRAGLATAALAAFLCACAVQPETGSTPEALLTNNGLSVNGLSVNGLSVNGMSVNGLSVNGLSVNGLTAAALDTPEFFAWFGDNPALARTVMRYIARCALPDGGSLSWAWHGTDYRWDGLLGLAPSWSSGGPIPQAEQQLVTACLASHANKFGLQVPISVRGERADGSFIPLDPGEETTFVQPEGCFFGNLFDGSGVYSGAFLDAWPLEKTNPRGCAVENGLPGSCPPIQHVGSCRVACSVAPAPIGAPVVYQSCTVNVGGSDVTFLPLTTYLSAESVYTCGDGFCQFAESPYDPQTGSGCLNDCGSL